MNGNAVKGAWICRKILSSLESKSGVSTYESVAAMRFFTVHF